MHNDLIFDFFLKKVSLYHHNKINGKNVSGKHVTNLSFSGPLVFTLREERTAEEGPAEEKTAELITAIWPKKK